MDYVRTHNTGQAHLDINGQKYTQFEEKNKPRGLWYALDNEWLKWCESEMPDWVHKHNFKLDLNLDKVLVIDTVQKVIDFTEKYKVGEFPLTMSIDWIKVTQQYSGIEIRNYYDLKWGIMNASISAITNYMWLHSWDCSSGCIWDLKAVHGVEDINIISLIP